MNTCIYQTFRSVFLLIPVFLILQNVPVTAQYTTISNGNWNDPMTWSGGNVPQSNAYNSPYDSITIHHAVHFENGNLPTTWFVNYQVRISSSGSLTIDARDTLGTAEGQGGIPIFINEGQIELQTRSVFTTSIGNATYAEVYSNNSIVVGDSAELRLSSYDRTETNLNVQVNERAILLLISINGSVVNNSTMNLTSFATLIAEADRLINQGPITTSGDSSLVRFLCVGEGMILNDGPILGVNRTSMVSFSADDSATISNHASITNHAGFTATVHSGPNDTVFQNTATIDNLFCYFLGDGVGNWFNDGVVISANSMVIDHCMFSGTGNFCSHQAFTTESCDFSGTLDLCSQGFFGIVHINSTIGPDVTSCQGPCTPLSVLEELKPELLVYPQPAHDQVQFRSDNPLSNLTLYNATGQAVLKMVNPSNSPISLGELATGLYIYHVSDVHGNTFQGRLVVE